MDGCVLRRGRYLLSLREETAEEGRERGEGKKGGERGERQQWGWRVGFCIPGRAQRDQPPKSIGTRAKKARPISFFFFFFFFLISRLPRKLVWVEKHGGEGERERGRGEREKRMMESGASARCSTLFDRLPALLCSPRPVRL